MSKYKQQIKLLQDLYDSEISFAIDAVWDDNFRIGLYLDDPYTPKPVAHATTIEEAIEKLKKEAIDRFPNSKFAKNYE